jgi:hypothetical protein
MNAPRIVFVHQTRVQFCWKGVTGMIAARRGWFVAMAHEMAWMTGRHKRGSTLKSLPRRA